MSRLVGEAQLGERIMTAQRVSAPHVGTLLRNELVRQILTPEDCHAAGLSTSRVVKLGYDVEALRAAGFNLK